MGFSIEEKEDGEEAILKQDAIIEAGHSKGHIRAAEIGNTGEGDRGQC